MFLVLLVWPILFPLLFTFSSLHLQVGSKPQSLFFFFKCSLVLLALFQGPLCYSVSGHFYILIFHLVSFFFLLLTCIVSYSVIFPWLQSKISPIQSVFILSFQFLLSLFQLQTNVSNKESIFTLHNFSFLLLQGVTTDYCNSYFQETQKPLKVWNFITVGKIQPVVTKISKNTMRNCQDSFSCNQENKQTCNVVLRINRGWTATI